MSLLKRRTVDTNAEEKILTGLIISDVFCRDISGLISKQTIETPYISKVVKWCQDYYEKHKEAPGVHIQDIFDVEKEKLDPAEQQAIEAILAKLSERYEFSDINEEYFKEEALPFIDARELKYASSRANSLLELGRLGEAKEVYKSYKEISIQTSGWEDPFSPDVIRNHFADLQSKRNILFQLPGAIGSFIGPFERNWLVGILAPAKRGKTFWAIEIVLQAIFARRKAVLISLEMNSQRIRKRIYNRLTVMSNETKDYIFPVFDCIKNQENTCNKSNRKNGIRLLDPEGKKPTYDPASPYRPCVECRGNQDFAPSTWFTTNKIERMRIKKAVKLLEAQSLQLGYNDSLGSNLRVLSYPAFSANLKRVRSDIQTLEEDGFIPDVIAIDYPDILAPEDTRVTGRDRIDQTWKTLKGMTDEMHCNIFAPSQANRGSFDKKNVTQTDAAEDIRKIANADLFLAINQTPQEKKASITRISKIASRDEAFDQFASVIVLQQLALGQVCLDSYPDKSTNVIENIYEDFLI
jgi:hypothetical protein